MAEMEKPTIKRSLAAYRYYYGKQFFKEDFIKEITTLIRKAYNKEYAEKIIITLKEKKIKIINTELFFHFLQPIENFDFFSFRKSDSLKEYIQELVTELKRLNNYGASYIPLYSFFINLAFLLENNIYSKEEIKLWLDIFVMSATEVEKGFNPVFIRILDPNLLNKVAPDVSFESYKEIIYLYFQSHYRQKLCKGNRTFKLPSFEVYYSVFHSLDDLRTQYLYNIFNIPIPEIKEVLNSIKYWDSSSSEILTKLELLKSKSNNKNIELTEVLQELIRLKESTVFNQYNDMNQWINYISEHAKMECKLDNFIYKKIYTDINFFYDSSTIPSTNLSINCKEQPTITELEELIEMCYSLGCIRNRIIRDQKITPSTIKITLKDVIKPSATLYNSLYNKKIELYNRNFIKVDFEINYYYRSNSNTHSFLPENTDSFYVLSDIHSEPSKLTRKRKVNSRFFSHYNLFCGDSTSNVTDSVNWLKSHIKRGLFTHGEYFCINSNYTLQESINILRKEFPLSSPLKYLNNNCIEIQGVIFIGSCLYTDFNSFPDISQEEAIEFAKKNCIEFKKTRVNSINGATRLLDPQDYIDYYNESICYIREKLIEHLHEPVVIFTHFSPLHYSIKKEYSNSLILPYYTNNLKEFINNNKNIKMWCHGHTHEGAQYVYNNNTLVVSAPRNDMQDKKIIRGFVGSFEHLKSDKSWKQLAHNKIVFLKDEN